MPNVYKPTFEEGERPEGFRCGGPGSAMSSAPSWSAVVSGSCQPVRPPTRTTSTMPTRSSWSSSPAGRPCGPRTRFASSNRGGTPLPGRWGGRASDHQPRRGAGDLSGDIKQRPPRRHRLSRLGQDRVRAFFKREDRVGYFEGESPDEG